MELGEDLWKTSEKEVKKKKKKKKKTSEKRVASL